MTDELIKRLEKVNTFIFDVDGVLTDGSLLVTEQEIQRIFNVKDGYAIEIAIKAGYKLAIISGGKQESIRRRLESLGVREVHLAVGTANKPGVFEAVLKRFEIQEEQVLFMGDDIPDLLVMQGRNMVKACPADAVSEVQAVADYISPKAGGKGAVRDVIETTMKAQNAWMKHF